jgi:uncharacterized protein YbjT (DUF2867 family)
MRRNVLVTGATGKQGQAVIRALLNPAPTPNKELYQSEESHQYHVFALTRKASSPSAQHLAELGESITVVEGDLDHPDSVVKAFEDARHEGGIWGVFAVLSFPGLGAEGDGEERQGKVS